MTYAYDPFGNQKTTNAAGQSTAPHNPFGYTGQLNDTVFSGHLDLRARLYDPATGRFTSRDPYTPDPETPATAPYVYVENTTTTTRVDPNGMCSVGLRAGDGESIWDRLGSGTSTGSRWAFRRTLPGIFTDFYLDDRGPWFMDFFNLAPDRRKVLVEIPRREDCNEPRSVRHTYQPLRGGVPQGVSAILCKEDLKPAHSRTRKPSNFPDPPGWQSRKGFNRSHILADRFHGKWIPENIFTGYQLMNISGMRTCENRIADALKAGDTVAYRGTLHYRPGELKPASVIEPELLGCLHDRVADVSGVEVAADDVGLALSAAEETASLVGEVVY
ncbi:RHS repeat-associated core domain-containing protein [Streptomyces sp. YIM 98790]|uniref:RHS repeat-associated core domain-containing protein n=1 Tax=Streptomyces sp. YIM 98790 TaxID=2689077 RepID=UPI0028BEDC59|nr:RHS repeat-associated core domain-containing protein [Streptomyces sp. YIM 98790]